MSTGHGWRQKNPSAECLIYLCTSEYLPNLPSPPRQILVRVPARKHLGFKQDCIRLAGLRLPDEIVPKLCETAWQSKGRQRDGTSTCTLVRACVRVCRKISMLARQARGCVRVLCTYQERRVRPPVGEEGFNVRQWVTRKRQGSGQPDHFTRAKRVRVSPYLHASPANQAELYWGLPHAGSPLLIPAGQWSCFFCKRVGRAAVSRRARPGLVSGAIDLSTRTSSWRPWVPTC